MKAPNLEVKIGVGIDEFLFGISRETLKEKMGEPDEIEDNDEGDEEEGKIEIWHYDDLECSVEFIEGNNWQLSAIAINSEDCTMAGVKIMGKSLGEITSLIDALNLGEYESEKIDVGDGHDIVLLSVFDAGLNFWFEAGFLTELQMVESGEE